MIYGFEFLYQYSFCALQDRATNIVIQFGKFKQMPDFLIFL